MSTGGSTRTTSLAQQRALPHWTDLRPAEPCSNFHGKLQVTACGNEPSQPVGNSNSHWQNQHSEECLKKVLHDRKEHPPFLHNPSLDRRGSESLQHSQQLPFASSPQFKDPV